MDVGGRSGGLSRRLLGRHVRRRSHEGVLEGIVGEGAEGEAEVEHAGAALGVDEDVAGLQVSVNDPALMGGGDGVRDLTGDGDRVRGWERAFAKERAKIRPFDEVHRVVGAPVERRP